MPEYQKNRSKRSPRLSALLRFGVVAAEVGAPMALYPGILPPLTAKARRIPVLVWKRDIWVQELKRTGDR